jgi:hypothetical protein
MNSKPMPPISMPWEMLGSPPGVPDAIRSALQRQAEGFWQAQLQAIDAMQGLATGWFGRHRDGVAAARTAAAAMCACGDPVEALRAYQTWATGCVERFTADVMAVQSQLTTLAPMVAATLTSTPAATGRAQDQPAAKPRREAA